MTPAILMLYGPYDGHPWREDMLHRMDDIQARLKKLGYGLDVAMVTHGPTGRDEIPEVRVARDPVFDRKTGLLSHANFQPGSIEEYPAVIDHWVRNFQDEVPQPDGTVQRTAYGIGLPAARLWNHKNVQTFGNRKDLMDDLINGQGVGIDTYKVTDYDRFASEHGTSQLIYKPQGGARGKGIEVFQTLADLKRALERKRVAVNGFIQPYLQIMNPIQGVKPATAADAELLERYNQKPDRPREIRMYVITTTDQAGNLHTEACPVMKISEPNRTFLQHKLSITLDPACLGPGTFMHDKSVELAQALCREAGDIPQYYGVFDWLVDGDVHDPDHVRVGDGNCRIPGLSPTADVARDAYAHALVASAQRNLKAKK
jgi:hypothetical protein